MGVNLVANPVRFLSQPELRCGIQHAGYAFFWQVFQRRLTATRSREWDVRGKRLLQRRRIDTHLRYTAIRFCAREEVAIASLDENVKHGCFERRIDGVPMCFPTAITQIDLYATANRLAPAYPNCSITKIRTSFAVPGAKLDDLDFVSGSAHEMFTEIASKPARLQLQLGWNPRRDEQRALMHASDIAHLPVPLCQSSHGQIMRRACANVTRHAQIPRLTCWGAQAASLQVSAACRDREWRRLRVACPKML